MTTLQHEKITPYKNIQLSKKQQVALMFNNIANTYDWLNRILSFRIDLLWRKKVINHIKLMPHNNILDVATGTGDLAIQMANKLNNSKIIIGIDIAEKMLAIAEEKIKRVCLTNKVSTQVQDAENMTFEAEYFNVVTASFGIRNFENLTLGLQEIYRVLKKNGSFIALEFSNPTNPIIKILYKIYGVVFINLIGRLLSNDKNAYTYLNKSSAAFPTPKELKNILLNIGFDNVNIQCLSFGICTLYVAKK